jgi:aryl-alcohol dehydrogenase-like predicted oxidoreductase
MAIPTKELGKTGAKVSAVGLGGHHLGDFPTYEEAERVVHDAVEHGIRFFDNCWEYHNGKSEDWMGRALRGRRDGVFLMTKVCTHGRDASLAMEMLDQSLRRLQTDHLDLWQVHGMGFGNDPELAYRKGGVIEALEQAKQSGKVRFVGFTGHKDPEIHKRMVELGFPFDTVQMPLNCFDASFRSFEQTVLPELTKRGIAPLGMKPHGGRAGAIKKGIVTAEEMLRYAMSLPVATTICGIDSADILNQVVRIASSFQAMSPNEMDALRAKCRETAGDGRFEIYKVSLAFDNPEARRAHMFPTDPKVKETAEEEKEIMGTP